MTKTRGVRRPLADLGLVALVAAALVLVVLLGGGGTPRAVAASRPNVVVIETDDQTAESMRVMANTLHLLGDEGATFDNSFVSFSLCCPSRATFLTGQYAHNHGVLSNEPPTGSYYKLDNTNTLPVWLQKAGYYTILVGRYLNHYGDRDPHEIPPGWNDWHAVIGATQNYIRYTMNENGAITEYGRSGTDAQYQTDVLAAKAEQAIRERAGSGQPFFLWLPFVAPHVGGPHLPDDPRGTFQAPRPPLRYQNAFASEPLPMPPSFNEADVSDKPGVVSSLPLLNAEDITDETAEYRRELETLLAVDDAVKGIVDTLSATGQLDNTVIIYTSDNGFMRGEHRIKTGKVVFYEPSIRVPLLIRLPGAATGVHLEQEVANIDLAPTIVDLAGATPERTMDGSSLVPLLEQPNTRWDRDLLLEEGTGFEIGIRTPRYKYVKYSSAGEELYDLARDPDELDSRHDDPAYAPLKAELARRLALLRNCAGAAACDSKGPTELDLAVPTSPGQTVAAGWGGRIPAGTAPQSTCDPATADHRKVVLKVPPRAYDSVETTATFSLRPLDPLLGGATRSVTLSVFGPDGRLVGTAQGSGDETVSATDLAAGAYDVAACGASGSLPQEYSAKVAIAAASPPSTATAGTDLALSVRADTSPLVVGGTIAYRITVTDVDKRPATNVVLEDVLPSKVTLLSSDSDRASCRGAVVVVCAVDLGRGPATLTLTVRVNSATDLVNVATVRAKEDDPVPTNNVAAYRTLWVDGAVGANVAPPPRAATADGSGTVAGARFDLHGTSAQPRTARLTFVDGTAQLRFAARRIDALQIDPAARTVFVEGSGVNLVTKRRFSFTLWAVRRKRLSSLEFTLSNGYRKAGAPRGTLVIRQPA